MSLFVCIKFRFCAYAHKQIYGNLKKKFLYNKPHHIHVEPLQLLFMLDFWGKNFNGTLLRVNAGAHIYSTHIIICAFVRLLFTSLSSNFNSSQPAFRAEKTGKVQVFSYERNRRNLFIHLLNWVLASKSNWLKPELCFHVVTPEINIRPLLKRI